MTSISVGLAEIKFSRNPDDIIIAHGLGSCVGVAIYDASCKLGGMIHVVLPSSSIQKDFATTPERFADTGIPVLLNKFLLLGGKVSTSYIKIAGGANMFQYSNMSSLDIGGRNIMAVKETLSKYHIIPSSEDVGGCNGRTFSLHIATGKIFSRMIGMKEREI